MSAPRVENYDIVSFDCYGTLVDWESSIVETLQAILQSHDANMNNDVVLEYFAEWEPLEQAQGGSYRSVLDRVFERYGYRLGFTTRSAESKQFQECIAKSVPFEDTLEALNRLQERVKIAIISNTDNELFAITRNSLDTDFNYVITAEDAGVYKPNPAVFEAAIDQFGQRERVLHVAQSLFHDIEPATKLNWDCVWIDRTEGRQGAAQSADVKSKWTYPDLKGFLDEFLAE